MHVVVGHDEQPRRIGEGRVVGEPLRIGVAVRADDRQLGDRRVEPRAMSRVSRIGGKQSVRMQRKRATGKRSWPSLQWNGFAIQREIGAGHSRRLA